MGGRWPLGRMTAGDNLGRPAAGDNLGRMTAGGELGRSTAGGDLRRLTAGGKLSRVLAMATVIWGGAALAAAQAPPARPSFLVINQERILTGSQVGQALLAEEEAARDKLRREARDIDSAFEAEERHLTELRPTLAPEEFRALADAFDGRVVSARREQDARSAALVQEYDRRRRQFYVAAAPVLVALMDRYGVLAIFDENSVLLADQTLDITDAVIAEIDAAPPEPDAPAPADTAVPDAAPPEPAAPAPVPEAPRPVPETPGPVPEAAAPAEPGPARGAD